MKIREMVVAIAIAVIVALVVVVVVPLVALFLLLVLAVVVLLLRRVSCRGRVVIGLKGMTLFVTVVVVVLHGGSLVASERKLLK